MMIESAIIEEIEGTVNYCAAMTPHSAALRAHELPLHACCFDGGNQAGLFGVNALAHIANGAA